MHNVHHPVSINLYYEDQKAEALRAAEQFRASRLPKFFKHFQSVLETNPANKDGKGNVLCLKMLEMIVKIVGTNKLRPFLNLEPYHSCGFGIVPQLDRFRVFLSKEIEKPSGVWSALLPVCSSVSHFRIK